MKKILDDLKAKWAQLKPEHKKKVAICIFIAFIAILGYVGDKAKKQSIAQKQAEIEERRQTGRKNVPMETALLKKDDVSDLKAEVKTLQDTVTKLAQDKENGKDDKETEKQPDSKPGTVPAGAQKRNAQKSAAAEIWNHQSNPSQAEGARVPPPPGNPPPPIPGSASFTNANGRQPFIPGSNMANMPKRPAIEYIGDIQFTPGTSAKKDPVKDEKDKKKRTVYLPSGSIFKATIIIGGGADAMHQAKGEPEPILLRVRAPGILPNDVRARMEGCFFTGEMTGSLSKECAKVRLLTFSCIDKKGNALIDQDITGYVADENGNNCIRGDVVWKADKVMSKALWVSLFGAVGSGAQAATTPSNALLASGVVNTGRPSFGDAMIQGAGAGLKQTTDDLKGILVNVIKETPPTIDIGSVRDVTVVIKKGLDLEIKTFDPNVSTNMAALKND